MAVKSQNRTNVYINKNFVIRVFDYQNNVKTLASANTITRYVDEKIKIKLFKKVLEGKLHTYTFLFRKRLKLEFHSK